MFYFDPNERVEFERVWFYTGGGGTIELQTLCVVATPAFRRLGFLDVNKKWRGDAQKEELRDVIARKELVR